MLWWSVVVAVPVLSCRREPVMADAHTCTADTPGAPPEIGNDEEEDEDMQLALRMSRGD